MRIGKFTGHFYEEDYDFSKCPECCHCLSSEISIEETLKFRDEFKLKDRMKCLLCMGCPAAKETNNVGLIGFVPEEVYGKLIYKQETEVYCDEIKN